jgi:hypothetical protein
MMEAVEEEEREARPAVEDEEEEEEGEGCEWAPLRSASLLRFARSAFLAARVFMGRLGSMHWVDVDALGRSPIALEGRGGERLQAEVGSWCR